MADSSIIESVLRITQMYILEKGYGAYCINKKGVSIFREGKSKGYRRRASPFRTLLSNYTRKTKQIRSTELTPNLTHVEVAG